MLDFYAQLQKNANTVEKASLGLLALLFFLFVLPSSASAQPEEILTAKKVSRKITFGFHPNDLVNPSWEMRYAIDDDFQWKDSKRFKGVVALAAPDEFNILTTFVNPLAYRVTISESISEDQASKATEQFLEKLVHLFPQAVASQSPQSSTASVTNMVSNNVLKKLDEIKASNLPTATKELLSSAYLNSNSAANGYIAKQKALSEIRSPELLNLLLWVETRNANDGTSIFTCLKKNAGQAELLRKACAQVERQYYAFPEQINQTVIAMRAPITHSELQSAMPDIIERNKQLRNTLDSTQFYIARLQYIAEHGLLLGDSIVDAKGNKIKTNEFYSKTTTTNTPNPNWKEKEMQRNICVLLQDYVRFIISTYLQSALEKQKVREELYASMQPLVETLRQAVIAEGYDNDDKKRFLHRGSVESERGIVKDVTLVLKKINLTLTDNSVTVQEEDIFTGHLRVRQYAIIVSEVGTGGLVSNLLYPRFGTVFNSALNSNVVADAGADRVNEVPMAMLNTFLRRGPSPFLPVFQLGVGTGRDARPTLFTGLGLRFLKPNHLAFSVGSLWNFQQQLTELQLGQPVAGEAVVKEDIRYVITDKPKFAIGLQYSF